MTTDDANSAQDSSLEHARLSRLESEVASLRAELDALRASVHPEPRRPLASPQRATPSRPSISGAQLESVVGRYGTLAGAALVVLLGLGTLIVWAVKRGLLVPEVRIGMGALAAACVAGAGWYFRQRGERRYGSVLFALSLAMVDLVAWGAGPRLHVIPTGVALLIVDLVSLAIAALALRDDSEFLYTVAVAGAMSAPFVTSDSPGTAAGLLWYGGVVLLGSMRAVRRAEWRSALYAMLGGAAIYVLAASALPIGREWYGPYLIPLFGGVLALGALTLCLSAWRGELARGSLAVALLGVLIGWDRIGEMPWLVTAAVSASLLAVTHWALGVREPARLVARRLWVASAVGLPMLSYGIAAAGARDLTLQGTLLAPWGWASLVAWRFERARAEHLRGGVHLMTGGLLVSLAIAIRLRSSPLDVVIGLSAWGAALAWLARHERSRLPLAAVALTLGASGVVAVEQLLGRSPYEYMPFATLASASALCAAIGLRAAGAVLATGGAETLAIANRSVRLGTLLGFLFVWARMEFAYAVSADVATVLLTFYYAAVGVGSIVAGRRFTLRWLRLTGLALAIYAGVKAVVEATTIEALALRLACYAGVGLFLLGAGYLYRNADVGGFGGSHADGGGVRGEHRDTGEPVDAVVSMEGSLSHRE